METGPGHFGFLDKNTVPQAEIKKDLNLENAEKLNSLIAEKVSLLENGPEKGNEIEFENKLTDLENMISQLEGKV